MTYGYSHAAPDRQADTATNGYPHAAAHRHSGLCRPLGQTYRLFPGWSRTDRPWRRRSNRCRRSWTALPSTKGKRWTPLVQLATFYEAVFADLIGKPWVKDALDEPEVAVVHNLRWLAREDESAALRLVSMPFLNEVEPSDGVAMRSLWLLAHFNAPDYQRVMSYPTLRAGISDDWAKLVAVLSGVSRTNSLLINALLDPDRVTLEGRTIILPQAGPVDLAIIRTGPGAGLSMDLLEAAVRHAEAFVAEPFPIGYVALLFENVVVGSFAGTNFGTHMAVRPEHDVLLSSNEADSVSHTRAHEVAHYDWSGNGDWVDDGASDFMASIAESARTGQPAGASNLPCGYTRNISDLEGLNSPQGSDAFDCNYALGETAVCRPVPNPRRHQVPARGFEISICCRKSKTTTTTQAGTVGRHRRSHAEVSELVRIASLRLLSI